MMINNPVLDKSISEEECKMVCECAFNNNIKKMKAVYEIRITAAVLTKNTRRAKLLQRDLVVISKLESQKLLEC